MMKITAYCDGACSANGKDNSFGGYAAIIKYNGKEKVITGATKSTTNQRMELVAAITAIKVINSITSIACDITIITDSQYVAKGMNEWVHNWQRKGWKTANHSPVLNKDLWLELLSVSSKHTTLFQWVKGHGTDTENIRCDELAVGAREALRKQNEEQKGQV